MTPAERSRWLHRAAALLPTIPALHGTDGAELVRAVLVNEARRAQSRIVFRKLDGNRWQIHHEDEAPGEFACQLVGLAAAWAAIDAGRSGHAAVRDFVAPGTRQPDSVVRKAIRRTATRWLEREGAIELATAFRAISVRQGLVQYRPTAGAPAIVTR
jgi:hypothetical protein